VQVNPYLNFDGDCAEAFRFYERVLGGRIEAMTTHGDSPIANQVPPAWRDRIMHARLVVGDTVLMASDSPPEHYQKPAGSYVTLNVEDPERGRPDLQRLGGKRDRDDADRQNLLGGTIRHAG
jgi:PhnB protein